MSSTVHAVHVHKFVAGARALVAIASQRAWAERGVVSETFIQRRPATTEAGQG